jgi:GNAT superfamily N-acetyltransferase
MTGPARPATGVWYARHRTPAGRVLIGVADPGLPDETVVDLPGPPARPARWVQETHQARDGETPQRVLVSDLAAPGAPLLWYVLLPADSPGPREVDLVAFSTADRPEGTVLDRTGFAALGIAWSNQVAAVRWEPGSGVVRQLYVAPEHRRRKVGSKVLVAANGVRVGCGWAPLHGDGRRTDLGQAWVTGKSEVWRSRVAERTERVRPMTPPSRTVGVPRRNLVPDRD